MATVIQTNVSTAQEYQDALEKSAIMPAANDVQGAIDKVTTLPTNAELTASLDAITGTADNAKAETDRLKLIKPAAEGNSLSDLIALAIAGEIEVGSKANTVEYFDGSGIGGNRYVLKDAGSSGARPAADGGSVIHVGTNGLYFLALFLNGVFIEQFGAVQSEVTDSSVAVQAAIDFASSSGRLKIFADYGTFVVHNIALKSGVNLVGLSSYQRQVGGIVNGVIFTRTNDVPMFTATGVSILNPSPLAVVNVNITGIRFDGGGLTFLADMFDLKVFYTSTFNYCMFTQASGRLLKMTECFDCRFNECRFEWGGTADGTVPGIELISNGGYEATNQIHFNGCVAEAMRGKALKTTDADGGTGTYRTNEIYFNQTKIECNESDVYLMDFEHCGAVHFNLLQLTARGTQAATNDAVMRFKNASNITGDVHIEITSLDSLGNPGADWDAYITSVLSVEVDINLCGYGKAISGNSAINHDGNNTSRFRANMIGRTTVDNTYPVGMGHVLSRDGDAVIEGSGNNPAALHLRDSTRVPGENWHIGQIVADGVGSKFRLMHNNVEVWRVQNDGKVVVKNAFRCDVSIELKAYTVGTVVAPGGKQGHIVYITDETGGQIPAFSDGTNWRRMSDRAIIA